MARYEITQSLLASWNYVFDCWPGCKEDAHASFLSALRREEEELTPEQLQNIQNGHDFEDLVAAIATGRFAPQFEDAGGTNSVTGEAFGYSKYPKWYRGANEIAQLLKGAQFQVRIHRPITVNGMDFEIHGVLDALREGVISDIKFKSKSFGSLDLAGDYLNSPQHPFYFYLVPEAWKFQYLVSDGTDLYIEQYFPEETTPAETLISRFIEYLETAGLMDEYKANWLIE